MKTDHHVNRANYILSEAERIDSEPLEIPSDPRIPVAAGTDVLSYSMKEASLPSPPSCVLFDFDGTMYSFGDVYPRVWRRFYDEERAAFPDVEFQELYDRIGGIFASLKPELDADEEHECLFAGIMRAWPDVRKPVDALITDYRNRSLEYMVPRPGLNELLTHLDANKIPWGIISNHDAINRHKLAAMDLQSQPATFMLSVEVGVWKPDVRIFEMAFEEIGPVDRASAVMVGDNPEADIAGGIAAGMRTVLMSDSPYAASDNGSADMTVGGFDELQLHWFGE